MTNFDMLVIYPIKEMLAKVASFIPTLVGALLILVVGCIIAKVLRDVVHQALKTVRFDSMANKVGVADVLDKGGIKMTTSELLGAIIHWLAMIMVLVVTVNALGLSIASQILDRLLAYVPNVVSAVFVLVIGIFLAGVIGGIVHATANNVNIPHPELLGKISKWAIIIFAGAISMEELGIGLLLVGTTFHILFGAVCLGLALAYGLGGREAAARHLDDLRKKR